MVTINTILTNVIKGDFTLQFIVKSSNTFTFIINDKEIPFDFEAYTNFIDERNERIYVEYVSGKGVFFNSYILDSCYHDEYKEIVSEILNNEEFLKRKNYHHHENRSVYYHSLNIL